MQQDKLVTKQSLLSNVVIDQRAKLNEDVDNYLNYKAKATKAAQLANSDRVLSELNIDEEDIIYQSQYSPMLLLDVDKNKINQIADSDSVETVDVFVNCDASIDYIEDSDESISTNATSDSTAYNSEAKNMSAHKSAIGGVSYPTQSLNGDGIVIGQIECGLPAVKNVLPNLSSDLYDSSLEGNVTALNTAADARFVSRVKLLGYDSLKDVIEHANRVAHVLTSANSMTSKSSVVSTYVGNMDDEIIAIEKFLSEDIRLINMSMGSMYKIKERKYENIEKWFDYMVAENDMIIVNCAGNVKSDYESIVWSPAEAYNVITVGAINDNMTPYNSSDDYLESYSLYNTSSELCAKPDVVAPGNYYYSDLYKNAYSGTSFATPMTTSTIALMLQKNTTLRKYPAAVKAILLASCNRKVANSYNGSLPLSSGISQKQGAGVINVSYALQIVQNGTYLSNLISVGNTTSAPVNEHIELKKSSGSNLTVGLTWQKIVKPTTSDKIKDMKFNEKTMANLSLAVYGLNSSGTYGYCGASTCSNSSTQYIFNSNANALNNKYKFCVIYQNYNASNVGNTEYALAWN